MPPTFLKGFWTARGRPESQNDRFSIKSLNTPSAKPPCLAPPVPVSSGTLFMCTLRSDLQDLKAEMSPENAGRLESTRSPSRWSHTGSSSGRLPLNLLLMSSATAKRGYVNGASADRRTGRPEIVDLGGLGGPGRPGNLPKKWGASPPTFLEGIPSARGRPDHQNRRSPVGQKNTY